MVFILQDYPPPSDFRGPVRLTAVTRFSDNAEVGVNRSHSTLSEAIGLRCSVALGGLGQTS
jgi:hypothetical protein